MKGENKTNKQLIKELEEMRRRVAELEALEAKPRQIDKKLHESEDGKFKNLADSLNEVVYRTNPKTLEASYVNRAIEKIYGYTVEEWINDPKLWENTIHPEDNERVLAEFSEIISKIENRAIEYRIIRKDKAARWVRDHISFEIDQQGTVIAINGLLYDITDRKRVEERMLIRDGAFLSVSNGIVITDPNQYDNPIIHCNPAFEQITGYSRDEIVGRNCRFLLNDDRDQEGIKELNKAIEEGRGCTVLLRNYKKDGTMFWNELTISLVEDESGILAHFVGVINDVTESKASEELQKQYRAELEQRVRDRTAEIAEVNESLRIENTERKQAEKQLKASREQLRNLAGRLQSVREEEKTKIARDIHDKLGQELTGLKMNLGWLGKRLLQVGDVVPHPLLERITYMSERVDTTIQTVREISTELRPGVLDAFGLKAAIEWQAQEFQTRLGIRFKVTSSPENITLDQYRSTEIFRIFQETLTNVARHANATRVTIDLKKNASNLILKVRDNGKGITESEISHPKSLGLLGMRERALVLGGELKISGTAGKGTTATIKIPLKR